MAQAKQTTAAAWTRDPEARAAYETMKALRATDPRCAEAMRQWNRLAWAADRRERGQ